MKVGFLLMVALPFFVAAPPAQAAADNATKSGSARSNGEGSTSAATVEGVTVNGAASSPVRSSIDRLSYSLKEDLQAATGSIGDALRRVPSVQVDVEGNLSLRGDPN